MYGNNQPTPKAILNEIVLVFFVFYPSLENKIYEKKNLDLLNTDSLYIQSILKRTFKKYLKDHSSINFYFFNKYSCEKIR